jgi:hypothetical protein
VPLLSISGELLAHLLDQPPNCSALMPLNALRREGCSRKRCSVNKVWSLLAGQQTRLLCHTLLFCINSTKKLMSS